MGGRETYEADREWLGLYRLNDSIVGDAVDPYQIALRIEEHLRRGTLLPRRRRPAS